MGPKIWPEGVTEKDAITRLARIASYRQWAVANKLPHLVISRAEVENLLKWANLDPDLAVHAFPKGLQSTVANDLP